MLKSLDDKDAFLPSLRLIFNFIGKYQLKRIPNPTLLSALGKSLGFISKDIEEIFVIAVRTPSSVLISPVSDKRW